MNDDTDAQIIEEIAAEVAELPSVVLNINLDVNDLLVEMSEAEVFDFVGKLKDLVG